MGEEHGKKGRVECVLDRARGVGVNRPKKGYFHIVVQGESRAKIARGHIILHQVKSRLRQDRNRGHVDLSFRRQR